MATLRKVLCPVDFSAATERQVRLAAEVCGAFGATLALHHNLVQISPGMAVGWMYSADHHSSFSEDTAHQHLRGLAERLAPAVPFETHVTHGASATAIIAISRALDADLVIVSTHGASSDDHASVTEHVLKSGHRAVLVLHDAGADAQTPHFSVQRTACQIAVVPIDFTAESRAALAWALDLGVTLGFEVHLVNVLPRRSSDAEVHNAITETQRQIEEIAGPKGRGRTFVHVKRGDPAKGIVTFASELSAVCIVMGEHTRAPVRRWFSRDVSRGVLHDAPCPVWYVPGVLEPLASAIEMPPPA